MTAPLPADAFPHLIDAIFSSANPHSLLSLRATSAQFRTRADLLLLQHLRFDGTSFTIPTASSDSSDGFLRIPVSDWLTTPLTNAVRVLDIAPLPAGQPVQPSLLAPAARFRGLRTAVVSRVLDYWEHGLFEVDTLVLPSGGLRAGQFDLLRKQVRRRIVAHVPASWPERLFADLGTILKFGRASELVLIFSSRTQEGGKRGQGEEDQEEEEESAGAGTALGLAAARGFGSDNMTSNPLAVLDVAWPHLQRRLRIDVVNSGLGRRDWEDEGEGEGGVRRATEWRLWRRFEAKHPESLGREEMLECAHERIRFLSLDEYAADVGNAYDTEMCL
ncbi:hypothetical protein CspeluHIS016_0500820 [Cutaneotrichosporon spelunceum]|uniref:F-box domain-containing protein n=1 Tax=Cutaneotrichosporon spelunceum TaxID=1672016 RepID=A0AAD3TW67_9TREE|nr:hypothetical protein CspeluHIS016_0500820 [Cutaneotrichosporon spelunceum]